MRRAWLMLIAAVFLAGCGEIKKEIETPGPAPPYNPKEAALDPAFVRDKPVPPDFEKPPREIFPPLGTEPARPQQPAAEPEEESSEPEENPKK